MKNRSFVSKNIRWILTSLVFVLFALYFILNIEQFKPLLHINIYLLVLIAIGFFATISANGVFIKFILRPFDKHISVFEGVYVSLISSLGNFFAPAGSGFGFRAVYLKKKHNLAYSDFVSTLSGNYIIVFLINSFFALVSLYLLRGHSSSQYTVLVILFLIIFVSSLILSLIKLPHFNPERITQHKHTQSFIRALLNVTEGWNKVTRNKRLMIELVSIVLFNFVVTLAIAKLEIASLHLSISFPSLLLFSVLGSLSLFINLTPANLGVKEAIYIFSGEVIGLSTSQILSIALIDRGVFFIVLAILWAFSTKLQKLI